MIELIFHTVMNILWIIILAAIAAIAVSIARVVVQLIFFEEKGHIRKDSNQ